MKLNYDTVNSMQITLKAIKDIDEALNWYKEDKPGPAYMSVCCPSNYRQIGDINLQFNREHFREFMLERREQLIKHLEERFPGFEYDEGLQS